jgi:integrase/recombinase XerD
MSHQHAPGLERLDAPSAAPDVLAEFGEYLRTQRRLAPLTISTRTDVVRRFLRWRAAGHGALDLHRLSVTDVHTFVVSEASRLRRGSINAVLEAVRSFLRYLFATGVTKLDLATALPSVAARRPPGLPRSVDAATMTALLSSCDRNTAMGLRDFAILTVMSRLGLRANEVAQMRLDDVDWRAGELLVHSKGGGDDRLPLPDDVGQALVAYLRHGRPATTTRVMFLRARPPLGPLSRNGVVFVPRNASARAGIAVIGAHRLRHTAAIRMLQAGASLREVGQVLRHDRDQTTSLYLHLDDEGLTSVVRRWPETAR